MPRLTLDDLVMLRGRELDSVMRRGHAVDPAEIEEHEFDGVSLNLPRWLERLTWVKFKKVFHRERTGTLRGWNCRAVQSPLSEPWVLAERGGRAITYGHYRVVSTGGYALPRPYGAGLMLDYGRAGNPRFDATALVRDPVIAVNEGSAELLLGWTYLDLRLFRIPTPSYFALRRGVRLSHVVEPPRPVD